MPSLQEILAGGAGDATQQKHQMANPPSPKFYNNAPVPAYPASTPGTTAAPAASTSNDYMEQIKRLYPDLYASTMQMKQAAQNILPMYQARLSGLEGPTEQALRLRNQQAIEAQYGNALRAAGNQAAAQGVRGPAAIAMQNDIRNQMGQATANYQRDLTIADWDAKRQALGDYYQALGVERGGVLGTLGGLQQQVNINTGFDKYEQALAQQLAAQKKQGSNGLMDRLVSPQTMVGLPATPGYLNPMSWLQGVNLG